MLYTVYVSLKYNVDPRTILVVLMAVYFKPVGLEIRLVVQVSSTTRLACYN